MTAYAPNLAARSGRAYGDLKLERDAWVLSGIEPHVAIRLKRVFEGIPKATTKRFKFPNTSNICNELDWFVQRYPMRMSDADRALLHGGRDTFRLDQDEIEKILKPGWMPPARFGFKPGYQLWHMQAQAVEVIHRKKRLLLADSVGTGKTFTALGTLVGSPYLPAAILAKTHLPDQWVNEFIKPATYLSAHIIQKVEPYALPPANLYVFKYSNIAGWADIAATGMFKAFICDEVHELRTGISTSKGAVAKVFADHAEIVVGMSGTPIFNYGDEIFNICNIIMPGVLGDRDSFIREWCVSDGNHWVVDDPDALGTYLRELGVFLRRTREGRKVNTHLIKVDCDQGAVDQHMDLARELAIKTLKGNFMEAGQAARELDSALRQATGVAKARGVAAVARMLLEQGIPVLIACWHREVYRVLNRELAEFSPLMYTGSETAGEKERAKRSFINGVSDAMLISLRSADGIDGFQKRCHTVISAELDWSPLVHDQFIGRVDRPGQESEFIDHFYCWTDYGSDPSVMAVHGVKGSQSRGIVDPLAGAKRLHLDESRAKLLARKYLESIGYPI